MKRIIMLLIIGILFPINANALTGNIEISCDNTEVLSGSNINCIIKGNNFSNELSSFHAKIVLGDNLELKVIEKNAAWEGSAEDGIIDLYTDVNKSGELIFTTFTAKVNESGDDAKNNILVTEIKVGDKEFTEHNLQEESILIKVTNGSSESDPTPPPDEPDPEPIPPTEDPKPTPEPDPTPEINPDNGNESDDNKTNNEENIINPSTGSSKIWIVLTILLCSIVTIVLYKKKIINFLGE